MRLGTKNRIEEYNRRLPRIKEKLYAAGAGLLIALVISGMATYAWITLSRAPEVSAIATTISAMVRWKLHCPAMMALHRLMRISTNLWA